MKLLVTGGAGFIGKNLCRALLTEGNTVVAIDNLITSSRADIGDLITHPAFTFVQHDIVQPLPPLITETRFDQMYHLACPTGVPNVIRLGEEMLLTSSIGTKNILDFAHRIHASVVFTSSSEVYGDPLVMPQPEEYTGNVDPVGVRSTYEEGKRFAEALVVWYARTYNLRAMIVRLFNTYGPGMSESDTRVIPTFIRQAVSGQEITIHGAGFQRRTFCYVGDTVQAIVTVMDKGVSGEVYNIGSTEEIEMKELARLIKELTHSQSHIGFTQRPVHDHERRMPLLTKIQQLGWKPTISLREGLGQTINQKALL